MYPERYRDKVALGVQLHEITAKPERESVIGNFGGDFLFEVGEAYRRGLADSHQQFRFFEGLVFGALEEDALVLGRPAIFGGGVVAHELA